MSTNPHSDVAALKCLTVYQNTTTITEPPFLSLILPHQWRADNILRIDDLLRAGSRTGTPRPHGGIEILAVPTIPIPAVLALEL